MFIYHNPVANYSWCVFVWGEDIWKKGWINEQTRRTGQNRQINEKRKMKENVAEILPLQ